MSRCVKMSAKIKIRTLFGVILLVFFVGIVFVVYNNNDDYDEIKHTLSITSAMSSLKKGELYIS